MGRYLPIIFTLTLTLFILRMIKGRGLSVYSILAIIGFLIAINGSAATDLLTGVLRRYRVREEMYTQTVGDLVYYLSIDLCLLSWAIMIRYKSRLEKVTRSIMQLAIDYLFWDMIFLCITDPYVWDKSELKIYGLSAITFLIIYYFEYISLWLIYMAEKVGAFFVLCYRNLKTFYYAHFKNNKDA